MSDKNSQEPMQPSKITEADRLYTMSHVIVGMERVYDLLLLLVDMQADDDGETLSKVLEKHGKHEYKWPD